MNCVGPFCYLSAHEVLYNICVAKNKHDKAAAADQWHNRCDSHKFPLHFGCAIMTSFRCNLSHRKS